MLFWNIFLIAVWHIVCFVSCLKLSDSTFDASRNRYTARSWERGGRWYRDNLKIQFWKDKVPQHTGKNGLSKRHFAGDSIEYLDTFILETCRGEWMHMKNCLCAVVILLINPLLVGFLLSTLILLGNLPFAMIQRYNRFRLLALRKKRLRDLRSPQVEQNTVTV